MATLTGSTIASTYKQLLKVTSEGIGDDASAKYIEDGLGTDSALSISTTRVGIGTADPSNKFTVQGYQGGSSASAGNGYVDFFAPSGYAHIQMGGYSGSPYGGFLQVSNGSAVRDFSINPEGGNVGIGIAAPDGAGLHIHSATAGTVTAHANADELVVEGSGATGISILTADDQTGSIMFGCPSDTQSARITNNQSTGIFLVSSAQTNGQMVFESGTGTEAMRIDASGDVGIGTAAPGQLLDVNSGGGNMIADGYDTHSLAVYKENIEDASGYLDKVLACPAQKWNRKPFVSANEIKEAVLEEFGEDVLIEEAVEAQDAVYETIVVQEAVEEELWAEGDELPEGIEAGDVKTEAQEEETEEQLVSEAIEAKDAVYEKQYSVWDELFPEDNSHRQKALYNMPDGDLKTWIDDWCEAKRVEMRPENKWQKKRLGLVADAELTAEHLPEVVSINDDGEPTGIDTMTYIGILHNAIQELSAKVEALENA